MLSFISKILSQHVALLVATRISPCFALPKCCIHSHSGLSALLHIGLSQHAFLRAPHSRNAAYIRIPGYRRFSTLVCRNTSCFLSQHAFLRASHSRNAAYIRIPGYRCFSVSFLPQHVLLLVATRISPCSALPKCCIHSHSGLSTLLHIGLSQHVVLLVATRISLCFALSKCCIHSHSGLSPYLLMYV